MLRRRASTRQFTPQTAPPGISSMRWTQWIRRPDGTAWYKQYAVDAVDKTPYMAPDGSIAYNESIVKKLPPTPKRKDKI